MSTSYYWILDGDGRAPTGVVIDRAEAESEDSPDWHIGTQTSQGHGRRLLFTWAQQPESVAIAAAHHFGDPCIVDELGNELTGGAFSHLLFEMDWSTDHIGEAFA